MEKCTILINNKCIKNGTKELDEIPGKKRIWNPHKSLSWGTKSAIENCLVL